MRNRSFLVATVLASGLSSGLTFAGDPVPPPGGFPIKNALNVPISWSDNYKTRLDIFWPAHAAPIGGWPGVLVVHGGGRSRKVGWAQQTMQVLAKSGYIAFGYDVRGDGQTPALNPGWGKSKGTVGRRIADIADCFYLVEKTRGAIFDHARLAVYGQSQGGGHALRAAAYSEKTMPERGHVLKMPKISAAISDIQSMDGLEDITPGGTLFASRSMTKLAKKLGINNPYIQAFLKDSPTALGLAFRATPGSYFLPELRASKTPLFVMNSYDDKNHVVNSNADVFPSLRAGVPHRFFLTTGGHGSQINDVEESQGLEFIVRWCNRFLKGILNGIDKEPFVEAAVIPANKSVYRDQRSHWQHRQTQTWPKFATTRYYLRSNFRLSTTPPGAIEAVAPIRNVVSPGYDALAYLRHQGRLSAILSKIPLDRQVFTAPTQPREVEVFGRAIVSIDVTSTKRNWQLSAVLYDVDSANNERYITSGSVGLRSLTTGRKRARIELADVAYVLPIGHKFRLKLQNLHIREQPGNANIYVAPFFDNYSLKLHVDPSYAARLELPLRGVRPAMTPRIATAKASGGIRHSMKLQTRRQYAGNVYVVLMGASGTAPGRGSNPRIPLNFDAWTNLGLSILNTPICSRFAGIVDAAGVAPPTFSMPPALASLAAGTRLSFTTLILRPTGGFDVSAPVTLRIHP